MIKRNLLVMGLAVLLSACGFQLRGTGTTELTIKELDVSARNAYGETVKQLRNTLQNSGVKVHSGAPYKLVLTNEQETQRCGDLHRRQPYGRIRADHGAELRIEGLNNLELLSDKLQVQRSTCVTATTSPAPARKPTAPVRKCAATWSAHDVRLQQLTPAQLDELQHKPTSAPGRSPALQEAPHQQRDASAIAAGSPGQLSLNGRPGAPPFP
jgi:LPS-assembly lipoprotein